MLNKLKRTKLQKTEKGFTIIEVMIVLAIAGLILLIVFLAVPALQRNSRNTQRKADASSIAASIATYLSNNGGNLPLSLGKNASANKLELCTGAGDVVGGTTICSGNTETNNLSILTDANVNIRTAGGASDKVVAQAPGTAVVSGGTSNISADQIMIIKKASCGDAAGTINLSPRSAAVFYVSESGSGNGSVQCVEQ